MAMPFTCFRNNCHILYSIYFCSAVTRRHSGCNLGASLEQKEVLNEGPLLVLSASGVLYVSLPFPVKLDLSHLSSTNFSHVSPQQPFLTILVTNTTDSPFLHLTLAEIACLV